MISVQPVLSNKYFQFKRNSIPTGIKSLFYLSWEDALWDILLKKNIEKGSVILVPNFYCKDVEKNIKKHGYRIAFYEILSNLKVNKKSFINGIKKYKPRVVIVFHPAGIKSNLLDNQVWLAKTLKDSILIEDSVHRVLDINDFKFIKKDHLIIDSLRKVVPIQGSRVFGNTVDISFKPPSVFQSFSYRAYVISNWFFMIICWTLGFSKIAEKLMLKGYDLIGDEKLSSRGSMFGEFLSKRINIIALRNIKVKQAIYYENKLRKILPVKLKLKESNKKHLRGYPVILPLNKSNKILQYLRLHGLLVRFELDGSSWSKKQKIIYLPLGFQINERKLNMICNLVLKAFEI